MGFERDVIFVDACWRPTIFSECATCEPVALLERFAKAETAKITRLAVGGDQGFLFQDPVPGIVKTLRSRIVSEPYLPGEATSGVLV